MLENRKLVASAIAEYRKGNYSRALEIYKKLGESLGQEFFYANIELCEQKISSESKNPLDSNTITRRKNKVVSYISRAKGISQETIENFLSTEKIVAIVVSQKKWSLNLDYKLKIDCIVNGLREDGLNPICMLDGYSEAVGDDALQSAFVNDGTLYLSRSWPSANDFARLESELKICVDNYVDWFISHKPTVVVVTTNFASALPAIIAAKRLSLPIVKESISIEKSFQDGKLNSFDNLFDFTERYLIEQFCSELADRTFCTYGAIQNDLNTLLDLVNEICPQRKTKEKPTRLKNKEVLQSVQQVHGDGLYYFEISLGAIGKGSTKGLVADFTFFDLDGNSLCQNMPGFASSSKHLNYKYISTEKVDGRLRVLTFDVQPNISKLEVKVHAFDVKDAVEIFSLEIGKVNLSNIARWISLKPCGLEWMDAVERLIVQDGAVSLYISLLSLKYRTMGKLADLKKLNYVVDEVNELEPAWLPEVYIWNKKSEVKLSDKLTVVHLHKTAYPFENTGGSIRCLNTVTSQLRMGLDPYIVTPCGYPGFEALAGIKTRELIAGVEQFRIGPNAPGLRALSPPDRLRYSLFHVAKILQMRGGNLIHAASGVRGYELALLGIALKQLSGLPLIYEVRSFHEHTWTSIRDDALELEKTKLRIIKENACMANADRIITISESMRGVLVKRGVDQGKIEVVPNAIDETKYLGKKFEPIRIERLRGADLVIGYVSNISKREGHEFLIRAIHRLREKTKRDFRGLFVGAGPERGALEKLCVQLNLQDVIFFAGEVDHDCINSYYKAIDIFVVPRVPDYAGDWVTPLKPYEAMALEIPIIVSDLSALKEIVGADEDRGLIARPADVDSLVTQLTRYIDDPIMRNNKAQAAKKWVFSARTWSSNATKYHEIYRRLIEESTVS